MTRIAVAIGTRPDAIKLAPVAAELERIEGCDVEIYSSGQHQEMIRPVLEIFGLRPSVDLEVMQPGQSLASLTGRLIERAGHALERARPDRLVVQGDSTTSTGFAWAAFLSGIPVGHVEAGLRTYDLSAPWPEELNRRAITLLADMHFAPTEEAQAHLLREGVAAERTWVTGNTVIDALRWTVEALERADSPPPSVAALSEQVDSRMILVTEHRRENIESRLGEVCAGLHQVLDRHRDTEIVFATHMNPAVREIVFGSFENTERVHLIPPVDYLSFVWLMRRAHLIVTDSGGIQEEAPSLGVPVVVTRKSTERPEAITAGANLLAGATRDEIADCVSGLLSDEARYREMAQPRDVYGDGRAAARIAALVAGG